MEGLAIGIVLVATVILVINRKRIVWYLGSQRPKRSKSARQLFRHPVR